MIKILVKAAILVCIILSIYFIVNPSACSNLINGRVVNSMDTVPVPQQHRSDTNELFTPSGDKQQATAKEQPSSKKDEPAPAAAEYSQDDIDYAIASRYVELENEYTKEGKDAAAAAKDISYQVMDDFELTPGEWESFLQRATASNLFEKIRQEQAAQENKTAVVTDTNSQQESQTQQSTEVPAN